MPPDLGRRRSLCLEIEERTAIVAQVAAGVIVSALVVTVVTVTAGAAEALPPLSLVFDAKLVVAALGVVVLVSAGGAYLATRRVG